jgi:flagellar basal-body rod modification protein FlgD
MTVVGSKLGTKTWGDTGSNAIQKSSGENLNSANELQKLQGQDIGEVLNKIADPNYVDQSKRVRSVGNDKMDKDAFMKMMLAQMKNQDPTNPLKSHEMAAQLAQFSGLEQMQNMNTTLNEIQKGQKPSESFQALNFIGKGVQGDSAKVIRMKGDKEHEFNFNLPATAKDIEIKVRNSEGDVIRKVPLHDLKEGENLWKWNGKNEQGNATPVGEYQFVVEAKGSDGKKLFVKTDFSGTISGVSYTAEGPVLMVGRQSVKLKDVKKIVDPSTKNNDQKSTSLNNTDLKNSGVASENEEVGAPEATPTVSNLMTSVGMSSGMMDKLKKETSTEPIAGAAPHAVLKEESKAQAKSEGISESSGGGSVGMAKKSTFKGPAPSAKKE